MTTRFLLRGGCVLTLGPKTPNFPEGDVLIEDGRIAEVGPSLRARDAEVVDATDAIVMPGFVDSHRHAWRSLLRSLGDTEDGNGSERVGREHYTADDVYAATLVGLLSAAEAGITTVVDWADLPPEREPLDAALRAHADAGVRSVFVHARGGNGGADRSIDPKLAAHLTEAAGPATTIAFGFGGLRSSNLDAIAGPWRAARELGRRIHAHAGPPPSGPGLVARLGERGLLGDDVTLLHCSELDDADLDALTSSGASVSLTPSSEMAGGASPPIQQLIDRDVRPGLGVDDERVAPGDMFAQMRATISVQHANMFERKLAGKAGLPRLMTTREVIRYATFEGARVAGVGETSGSLEPGKHADVIVLRADRPNIFPINDPIGAVVWGMDTSNVDWVFVGGKVLMREGALEADTASVRDLATAARGRVVAAAGLAVEGAREAAGSGAEG